MGAVGCVSSGVTKGGVVDATTDSGGVTKGGVGDALGGDSTGGVGDALGGDLTAGSGVYNLSMWSKMILG